MTTIATDGATIAADGLVQSNGIVATRSFRKIVVEDCVIYALAGTMCMLRPLIEWVKAGADPERAPKTAESDWGCLLVIDGLGKEGARCYFSKAPYPDSVDFPFAIGSGREIALGAMKAGKTPRQALDIAADCDIYSGGEIQVVDIAQALGLTPSLKVVG